MKREVLVGILLACLALGIYSVNAEPHDVNIESNHPYANNYDHTWTVEEPGAEEIRVHFVYIQTPCNDFVKLRDKNNKHLKTYSGIGGYHKSNFWSDWYTGDTLKIQLVTNGRDTDDGFIIDKYETRQSAPISSYLAESWHPYANNYDHTWTIEEPDAEEIRVHFVYIQTPCNDFVKLRDKNNKHLKTYSGIGGYHKSNFWSDWYTGDTLKIQLVTNGRDTDDGFIIDKVETRKPLVPVPPTTKPPSPSVSSDISSISIPVGEFRDITYIVSNNGGESDIESYLSVSVSSGLHIIEGEWSSSSSDMNFVYSPDGSQIWNSADKKMISLYELLDAYEAYSAGEINTVMVRVEATASGLQWIKYRTAFDTLSSGYNFIRNPTSEPLDQQGWHAYVIPVEVTAPTEVIEITSIAELMRKWKDNPTRENPIIGQTFIIEGAVAHSTKRLSEVGKLVIGLQFGLAKGLIRLYDAMFAYTSPIDFKKHLDELASWLKESVGAMAYLEVYEINNEAQKEFLSDYLCSGLLAYSTTEGNWVEVGNIAKMKGTIEYAITSSGIPTITFSIDEIVEIKKPSSYEYLRSDFVGENVYTLGIVQTNQILLGGGKYCYVEYPSGEDIPKEYSFVMAEGKLKKHEQKGIDHYYWIEAENIQIFTGGFIKIEAEITPFSLLYADYHEGDDVRAEVTVENMGDIDRSFYVGYSVKDVNGKWWDAPYKSIFLNKGESTTETLHWSVPSDAPAGLYTAAVAVWGSESGGYLYDRFDYKEKTNAFNIIKQTPTPPDVNEYKPNIYLDKDEKWELTEVYYYGPLYGYDEYAGKDCYCIEYWFKFNGDGDKLGDDWEPVHVFIDLNGNVLYCASTIHYMWDFKDTEADDFENNHVKVYFAKDYHTPIIDYSDALGLRGLYFYVDGDPNVYFEGCSYSAPSLLTFMKYPHDTKNPFSQERGDSILEITKPETDLTISFLSWSPENIEEGEEVTFSYTIKNQGTGKAGTSKTALFIDGKEVCEDEVKSLASGSSSRETFGCKWKATTGVHEIKVVADYNRNVEESNEGNNEWTRMLFTGEGDITEFFDEFIAWWNENKGELFKVAHEFVNEMFKTIDERIPEYEKEK